MNIWILLEFMRISFVLRLVEIFLVLGLLGLLGALLVLESTNMVRRCGLLTYLSSNSFLYIGVGLGSLWI
jgi:hypothetical protein